MQGASFKLINICVEEMKNKQNMLYLTALSVWSLHLIENQITCLRYRI